MTGPFLKLVYFSFCSIWPGVVWFQLLQVTCSFFELLMELALVYIFGIVANTSWWDSLTSKQQWQGLMCFTFWYHWENSSPTKVCGMNLYTSVAHSGHHIGKHDVWKYRMCQAMITKISFICFELSQQQRLEHSPNPSLCYDLNSLLSFLRGNTLSFSQDYWLYWQFSDHAYQC